MLKIQLIKQTSILESYKGNKSAEALKGKLSYNLLGGILKRMSETKRAMPMSGLIDSSFSY